MHTHHVASRIVDAYLFDFIQRLRSLKEKMPRVWCPIGESGLIVALALLRIEPMLLEEDTVGILEVEFDDESRKVTFSEDDAAPDLDGKHTLVLDDIIYSGITMSTVVRRISEFSPASIMTYSLVLSRSSRLIPSFWGWTVGDHDRVFFDYDEPYPNNRLCPGQPAMHLRKITTEDIEQHAKAFAPTERTEQIWSRAVENIENGGPLCTYLLEASDQVIGFVSIDLRRGESMTVEHLRVKAGSFQEAGAELLLRFAETMARNSACHRSQIWISEEDVQTFNGWGYEVVKSMHNNRTGRMSVLVSRATAYRVFRN